MPVRSRGSLLAGTVPLAALLLAGIGCHSHPADHDSFSMSSSGAPPGGLLSRRAQPVMPVEQGQPMVQYAPAAAAQPPAATPVTLQPVPAVRTSAYTPPVIASSWQPVQRVSAEQVSAEPDLNGNSPVARLVPSATVMPSGPMTTARVPLPGVASRMPIGSSSPLIDSGEGAPPAGGIVLPAPRPLGSASPMAIAQAGPLPPGHPPGPNVPREFDKMALPPYVVEPPDLLLIQASDRITLSKLQVIDAQHIVAPDGTINLGIYGKVRVAGLTLEQVADAVAARLLEVLPGLAGTLGGEEKKQWQHDFSTIELIKKELRVDVLSYNSKYYYVITDGGGYGQQVYPFLITGNETVLDAVAKINGLPAVASKKKIWVARATRPGQPPKILPVDWCGLVQRGEAATNYQLFPGDRVFVQSDGWIRLDTWLAKRLSPYLRGVGATLLTASTVNVIKNGGSSGAGLGSLVGGIR